MGGCAGKEKKTKVEHEPDLTIEDLENRRDTGANQVTGKRGKVLAGNLVPNGKLRGTIHTRGLSQGKEIPTKILIPPDEELVIPLVEKWYPPPKPPNTKKADIYDPLDCREADHIAQQVFVDEVKTFDELVYQLTDDIFYDLLKVRAIFTWIGLQNIYEREYSEGLDEKSPLGFFKRMSEGKSSYATLFAKMCRAANVPCAIIPGLAKGSTYEVGDTFEESNDQWKNKWNAVYVSGSWRLVFPLWAYKVVIGHRTGGWTLIETNDKKIREQEFSVEGIPIDTINEYFFLTDPEEFIYRCFPDDERWQLLKVRYSLRKFVSAPLLRPMYFEKKLKITSRFNSILFAEEGKCEISVKETGGESFMLSFDLYFNQKESAMSVPPKIQLEDYTAMIHEKPKTYFLIRFPLRGSYKLEIIGKPSPELAKLICAFKLVCESPEKRPQRFPISADIGFGPCLETLKAGLRSPSHETGYVFIKSRQETIFDFKLDSMLSIRTTLISSYINQDELSSAVSHRINSTTLELTIRVCVPQNGEYALQIYAKEKGSIEEFRVVCNYLLSTSDPHKERRGWETAAERSIRHTLRASTAMSRTRDTEQLQKAIDTFNHYELADHGDLADATNKLEYLRVAKALRDGINRRHMEVLHNAIKTANSSTYADRLEKLIQEAEEMLEHLKKLKLFAHDILEMNRYTISELHRYSKPKPVVHDSLKATYMLLGDDEDSLLYWEDIQVLLKKTGRFSLLYRVKKFDFFNVSHELVKRVADIISPYDEETARAASSGAGTFYVWVTNIIQQFYLKKFG